MANLCEKRPGLSPRANDLATLLFSILCFLTGILALTDKHQWALVVYAIIFGALIVIKECQLSTARKELSTVNKENLSLKYSHTSLLPKANKELIGCLRHLRDALGRIDESKNDACDATQRSLKETDAYNAIQLSLKSIAAAFTIISGSSCRACIKQVTNIDEEKKILFSRTFCRNEDVGEEKPPALINDDTDFRSLVECNDKVYFSNDLSIDVKDKGYRSSSLPREQKELLAYFENSPRYIATVVLPIVLIKHHEPPKWLGFLCIDSKDKNVFDKNVDVDFGAVIVESLLMVLLKYQETFSISTSSDKEQNDVK
ncbi:MAG: hypothetical protein LBP75_04005 [Planctomycetota bacterium]|jgi:hypothetical protein|nr:hypothetical protein [Planctomycetota bacterium]